MPLRTHTHCGVGGLSIVVVVVVVIGSVHLGCFRRIIAVIGCLCVDRRRDVMVGVNSFRRRTKNRIAHMTMTKTKAAYAMTLVYVIDYQRTAANSSSSGSE